MLWNEGGSHLETSRNGWADVARDFYYDLISRAPAGALVLLGCAWVLYRRSDMSNIQNYIIKFMSMTWAPAAVILLFVGLMSFALGIFLTGISDWLGSTIRKQLWKSRLEPLYEESECKELNNAISELKSKKHSREAFFRFDRVFHDKLKAQDPLVRKTLLRMRGEAALVHNGVAACIVVICFHFAVWVLDLCGGERFLTPFVFVFFGGVAATSTRYRTRSYLQTKLAMLENSTDMCLKQGSNEKGAG